MCAVKFAESVPSTPSVRISNFYASSVYPWLYVYRYTGAQSKIDKMVAKAKEMAAHGYDYYYRNPSFGEKPWCCVTIASYWIHIGLGLRWIMGSNQNDYFWSPRYGGTSYDLFLRNNGFKKMNYSQVGKAGLRAGDILMRNDHSVMIVEGADTKPSEEGFDVAKMPTLKLGSTGNVVKNLQALLNLWTTQTGAYEPILVDGLFFKVTEERLKLYQRLQGLYVDGICAEKTWSDILIG